MSVRGSSMIVNDKFHVPRLGSFDLPLRLSIARLHIHFTHSPFCFVVVSPPLPPPSNYARHP